jgi:hypothetical protein
MDMTRRSLLKRRLAVVALAPALLLAASGCGAPTSADGSSGTDDTPADSLPQVQPDPAAVNLPPADVQDGGTITRRLPRAG